LVARAGAGALCLYRRTHHHAGARTGKVRRRRACHRPAEPCRQPRGIPQHPCRTRSPEGRNDRPATWPGHRRGDTSRPA